MDQAEENDAVKNLVNREGGCQCGAIRYRLLEAPVALYTCHCRDCQKQSSSAFGMSLWVEPGSVAFSGKGPKMFSTRADSGNIKNCAFCGECGTRIYHQLGARTVLSMRAGTLDDTSGLAPTCHIWIRSAQSWMVSLLDGETCFDTMPPDGERRLLASQR